MYSFSTILLLLSPFGEILNEGKTLNWIAYHLRVTHLSVITIYIKFWAGLEFTNQIIEKHENESVRSEYISNLVDSICSFSVSQITENSSSCY